MSASPALIQKPVKNAHLLGVGEIVELVGRSDCTQKVGGSILVRRWQKKWDVFREHKVKTTETIWAVRQVKWTICGLKKNGAKSEVNVRQSKWQTIKWKLNRRIDPAQEEKMEKMSDNYFLLTNSIVPTTPHDNRRHKTPQNRPQNYATTRHNNATPGPCNGLALPTRHNSLSTCTAAAQHSSDSTMHHH